MNISVFDWPVVGKRIKNRVIAKEGGDKTSRSLREYILKKYKVDVGMYSYGSCFSGAFNTGGTVHISRYCSFGPEVRYFGADHPVNYAALTPYFYNAKWGGTTLRILREAH